MNIIIANNSKNYHPNSNQFETSKIITADEFDIFMQSLEMPYPLPSRIAIAVSGGADSMALTLLAKDWTSTYNIELIALTVDHALRDESMAEASQVHTWLSELGITHHILSLDEPITKTSSIQETARNLRYQTLFNWCYDNGTKHLFLAHHGDDQIETFLMRLISGSGSDGLAAMKSVSKRNNITLLRPLLSVEKSQLEATLSEAKQEWIQDPTNENDDYTRVRIRKKIVPLLKTEGLTAKRIYQVTNKLAKTSQHIEQEVADWLEIYANFDSSSAILKMSLSIWQNVPREIGWRALQCLLHSVGDNIMPLRSEQLLSLFTILQNQSSDIGNKSLSLAGCLLLPNIKNNSLLICREAAHVKPLILKESQSLEIEGKTIYEGKWDSRYNLRITVRQPISNTVLKQTSLNILGKNGYQQLTTILGTKPFGKMPFNAAIALPTLWHLETIIAIPHINYKSDMFTSLLGDNAKLSLYPVKALGTLPYSCINTEVTI